MKIKIDDTILLSIALQELKIDKKTFSKKIHQRLGIREAEKESVILNEKTNNIDIIWDSPSYKIITTKYGRIKSFQKKKTPLKISYKKTRRIA